MTFEEKNKLYYYLCRQYILLEKTEVYLSIILFVSLILMAFGLFSPIPLIFLVSVIIFSISLFIFILISRKFSKVRKTLPLLREQIERELHL